MIRFYKYQGTGNDFILIDNRTSKLSLNKTDIAFLCDRRFGIGADGLMLLDTAPGYDFTMTYYNSDGGESTMCGNGGRCITAFAQKLGLVAQNAFFKAIDGEHRAQFTANGDIALEMQHVTNIRHFDGYSILNTGSPHYVVWSNNVDDIDVFGKGKAIRNQPEFQPNGINVNFAELIADDQLKVRTYERGVEDETWSCGTGVTACAIAATKDALGDFTTAITTPGGKLTVSFTKNKSDEASAVVLTGPATFVFEGTIEIKRADA